MQRQMSRKTENRGPHESIYTKQQCGVIRIPDDRDGQIAVAQTIYAWMNDAPVGSVVVITLPSWPIQWTRKDGDFDERYYGGMLTSISQHPHRFITYAAAEAYEEDEDE